MKNSPIIGKDVHKNSETSLLSVKIPPQAVDLEEAVLGSLLQYKDALYRVCDVLFPDVFYKDQHRFIYDVINTLFLESKPVDLLTVSAELKKQGRLDQVGGDHYLIKLTTKGIVSAHVEYHSRIILQKYIAREIIKMHSSGIEQAYDEDTDVFDLLNQAYTAIASVTEKTIQPNEIPFLNTLQEAVVHGRKIYNKEVEAGLISPIENFNETSGGFRDSELIILAARPGMGKTAMALCCASHVAQSGSPVLFYSLEMSRKQLVQRVAAAQTEIHGDKWNKHGLAPAEEKHVWSKQAVWNRINSNLHIDDGASLSIERLKVKAKIAHRKHNIKMIVVDYLQLMKGNVKTGRNREQEISSISRGLKEIAKELNIPVLALSQLSRSVETRGGSKRPLLSDLRECLSVSSSFIYSKNNFQKNHTSDIRLLSLDGNTLSSVNSVNIPKDKNNVYRVKTSTGRFIDATANHPVLTTDGYVKVSELNLDHVLIAAKNFESKGLYYKESRLIGLMLGNGCMVGNNVPSFITNDLAVSEYFTKYIYDNFGFKPKPHPHYNSKVYQWDVTKHPVRTRGGNPFKNWLKEKDLWGRKSFDKYIPEWFIKTADSKSVCELISGLIDTDGSIYSVKSKNTVSYSTTSHLLASQVIYLLAKVGIIANIDDGGLSKKAKHTCYKITINDTYYLKIFRRKIKLIGDKKKDRLDGFDLDKRASYTSNKVSRETTLNISKLIKKGRLQIHGNRCATKNTLIKLSKENDLGKYKWLLSDNIHFDKIKSIKSIGPVKVFDRSVPRTNNFIVNGLVVHNSGAIEQDADMVVFLYRPEYYKITEWDDETRGPTDGMAEWIISKNRNGSLGEGKMAFKPQYSLFKDFEGDLFTDDSQDIFNREVVVHQPDFDDLQDDTETPF